MNIQNRNFASIDEMRQKLNAAEPKTNQTVPKNPKDSQTFGALLQDTAERVRFSKHASKRLETRNISMTKEQKARLEEAANQAEEKGRTESLVMVDNLAFILNVKNKTIVTAVNGTSNAVFTNIDGAIIN